MEPRSHRGGSGFPPPYHRPGNHWGRFPELGPPCYQPHRQPHPRPARPSHLVCTSPGLSPGTSRLQEAQEGLQGEGSMVL